MYDKVTDKSGSDDSNLNKLEDGFRKSTSGGFREKLSSLTEPLDKCKQKVSIQLSKLKDKEVNSTFTNLFF